MYVQYRLMINTWSVNTSDWSLYNEDVLVDNPEFVRVEVDSDGKILEGTRIDGTKVISGDAQIEGDATIGGDATILGNVDIQGVTYTLMQDPEWIRVIVDAQNHILCGIKADGSIYLNSLTEIPSIIRNAIQGAIQGIVNVEIASLEDRISAIESVFSVVDNSEYIAIETDSEGKILSGRNINGSKFENLPMEFKDKVSVKSLEVNGTDITDNVEAIDSTIVIDDPEGRKEIKTDFEGKVISYRDEKGTLHENVGIESPKVITNSLKLTEQGLTEFEQALKDSGFQPGGAGDWSDKESMYISEPRLAHLNIITNFDLTTLTKTSDVKCQVEFYDGVGNYFKKWIILNGQGRSSLEFIKKGLGADFFNEDPNAEDFDEDNVFSMKFGDWVYQDSFHIKSFYTDWPRCTTPIVYKLMDEVLRTRGIMEDRPYKKYYVGDYAVNGGANANAQSDLSHNMETGARCVPDGFPVIIYQNGEFWGVNSWQLKKHRDNYMLNKKKDTNIHLDGDMGTSHQHEITPPIPTPYVPFWFWNGNIDWTVYCSGKAGIETRNPKNLYCIDGKKYDADTHDAEIITTAIAEDWIAAGQIIPTGKVIDDTLAGYLRTTGKVRKHIEDLTTYIPYINNLIDGSILIDGQRATTEQIKAAIEDRFDVASFIDYIVLNNVVGNNDAWDNNGQLVTWGKLGESDNLNWSVNVYDCDITFGCVWDGKVANSANNYKLGSNYPLYKPFWDYYFEDLKVRYAELRDAGIFTADHITQLFRSWMDRVGYDNYSKEFKKWPETPCFRDGSKTYTSRPTTGGFYGSIERIYLWVKKRIEYMDAANFFDYNN